MKTNDWLRIECPKQLKDDFRATLGEEETISSAIRDLMRERNRRYKSSKLEK